MGKRLLLDHDPVLGMRQEVEVDGEGVTLITSSTNIRAALDANQRCRGVNTEIRRGDQVFGHHVASLPLWVYEQFCRENPELRQNTRDAQVWLKNRLNDPEFCHLRTYDGKV